jgi:secretion/DNA translocation related TadE-like protein
VRRPDQAGSATVLVIAVAGLVVFLAAALGVVAAMVHAHRVAQSAADLAALAGARGLALGHDGCDDARAIAAANATRLTSCRTSGATILVGVAASGPRWFGQSADLGAQARAGPG